MTTTELALVSSEELVAELRRRSESILIVRKVAGNAATKQAKYNFTGDSTDLFEFLGIMESQILPQLREKE